MSLLTFCPIAAESQEATPFTTRNLNPLVSIFGLPTWQVVEDGSELTFTSDIANHFRFSAAGSETLSFDGETWRNSLSYSHAIGQRWSVGFELPYYRITGGVLDNLIDGWHSFFEMPDGGRNFRPEGQVEFELTEGADTFISFNSNESGIGDVQLRAGRRFGADRDLHVTAALKLATGEERILTGSGSTDFALSLLRPTHGSLRGKPAGYFWGVAAFDLGRASAIRFEQRRSGYKAVFGGGWRVTQRLGIKGQIDAHTNLYHSGLHEIGQTAFVATLGGWLETDDGPIFDFGVVEDLTVGASPDVVIHLNARWRF